MKVILLGTGTSQGVPVIGCDCRVCKSDDSKDVRLRSSVYVEVEGVRIVIDSGPDFRQQMLRSNIKNIDGIIFTHEHKDHVAGLDDVRAFNWINKAPVNVYAESRVIEALKREFYYAFVPDPYPGVPKLTMNMIDETPFEIKGVQIQPVRGKHMDLPVLGFRIKDFTYLTDFNFITDQELDKVKGSEYVIINGLRKEKHVSHYTISEAVEILNKINPSKGFITHVSHQLGLYKEENILLPEHIQLAYDQLTFNC